MKELNSPLPLMREAEEDRNLLMQVLNLQAHALEQHLTNESYIWT